MKRCGKAARRFFPVKISYNENSSGTQHLIIVQKDHYQQQRGTAPSISAAIFTEGFDALALARELVSCCLS